MRGCCGRAQGCWASCGVGLLQEPESQSLLSHPRVLCGGTLAGVRLLAHGQGQVCPPVKGETGQGLLLSRSERSGPAPTLIQGDLPSMRCLAQKFYPEHEDEQLRRQSLTKEHSVCLSVLRKPGRRGKVWGERGHWGLPAGQGSLHSCLHGWPRGLPASRRRDPVVQPCRVLTSVTELGSSASLGLGGTSPSAAGWGERRAACDTVCSDRGPRMLWGV